MTQKEKLALLLWKSGALQTGDGRMPARWNGGAILADHEARTVVLDALEEMARDHYDTAQALLGGPWADHLAERLGLPVNPDTVPERALIVVDAVLSGTDLYEFAAPIRAKGISIAAAAVFNYGEDSARVKLDKADIRLHWLTDMETAAAVALQEGLVDFDTYDRLLAVHGLGEG